MKSFILKYYSSHKVKRSVGVTSLYVNAKSRNNGINQITENFNASMYFKSMGEVHEKERWQSVKNINDKRIPIKISLKNIKYHKTKHYIHHNRSKNMRKSELKEYCGFVNLMRLKRDVDIKENIKFPSIKKTQSIFNYDGNCNNMPEKKIYYIQPITEGSIKIRWKNRKSLSHKNIFI